MMGKLGKVATLAPPPDIPAPFVSARFGADAVEAGLVDGETARDLSDLVALADAASRLLEEAEGAESDAERALKLRQARATASRLDGATARVSVAGGVRAIRITGRNEFLARLTAAEVEAGLIGDAP